MFRNLAAQIRRLPWFAQLFAWPLYGIARVVLGTLGWAIAELTGQAVRGTKKAVGPLLWPLAGVVALFALFTSHNAEIRQLGGAILTLAIMGIGFLVMFSGVRPQKKSKKKRK